VGIGLSYKCKNFESKIEIYLHRLVDDEAGCFSFGSDMNVFRAGTTPSE
jgi:hypothetical protein